MKKNESRREGAPILRSALKSTVRQILLHKDTQAAIEEVLLLPPRHVINPLFALIQSGDPKLKWPAVRCFGAVVSTLANQDPESSRQVMRRLMWSLNDESGGIGWGSAEAMGESLARNGILAAEYLPILLSYAREDGNYLEHEPLQRGLLWGIGRAAEHYPEPVRAALPHLLAYLDSPDAGVRGLAARLMGLLQVREACVRLRDLARDPLEMPLDFQEERGKHRVKDLALEALESIPCP